MSLDNWNTGVNWNGVGTIPAGDVTPYKNLITSEHYNNQKFVAMIAATLQPIIDNQVLLGSITNTFNLDTSVGIQLDAVGEWIGVSRTLQVPIAVNDFSWDTIGLGWDQAPWHNPSDPGTDVVTLPDGQYRTLLRARVVNNVWDGSIPGAYAVWDTMFANTGYTINITDNDDMSMVFTLIGVPMPDTLTLALLNSGLLSTRPAGVLATYGYSPGGASHSYVSQWSSTEEFIRKPWRAPKVDYSIAIRPKFP